MSLMPFVFLFLSLFCFIIFFGGGGGWVGLFILILRVFKCFNKKFILIKEEVNIT